jgi:plasmid stabilization system protein ParE
VSRYLLSAEAQRDIEDIRTYYLTEATTGVARRVISELARGFQRLASASGIAGPIWLVSHYGFGRYSLI